MEKQMSTGLKEGLREQVMATAKATDSVVPTGMHEGLPVAVQVLGLPGADHVTLAAAQVIEDRFGGWRRATVPAGSVGG